MAWHLGCKHFAVEWLFSTFVATDYCVSGRRRSLWVAFRGQVTRAGSLEAAVEAERDVWVWNWISAARAERASECFACQGFAALRTTYIFVL